MTNQAQEIGTLFAAKVCQMLMREQWLEMVDRNETNADYAHGSCASHDFMDANIPMSDAFTAVTGRGIDADVEEDAVLWGEAWDYARQHCGMGWPS